MIRPGNFRPRRPAPALVLGDPSPPRPAVGIRHFCEADLPDCLYISKSCRARVPAGSPASDEPIRRHLSRGVPSIGIVATLEGYHATHVVGYALYVPREGSIELIDIGTEPFYRRRTVATHLVRWLRGRLGASVRQPRTRIEASVPASALGDLAPFLAAQGFSAVLQDDGRARRFVASDGSVRMVYEAGDVVQDTDCGVEREKGGA